MSVIILCHTRELAYQIKNEYARFSKYMPDVRTSVFYGGTSQKTDTETLKNKDTCPHIVVATPGRLNALVRDKSLNATNVKHFVLDECDKLLDTVGQWLLLLFLVCQYGSSQSSQRRRRSDLGGSLARISWGDLPVHPLPRCWGPALPETTRDCARIHVYRRSAHYRARRNLSQTPLAGKH